MYNITCESAGNMMCIICESVGNMMYISCESAGNFVYNIICENVGNMKFNLFVSVRMSCYMLSFQQALPVASLNNSDTNNRLHNLLTDIVSRTDGVV